MSKEMIKWESWEALEATIRRDTNSVASALHQSLSLIAKWKAQPNTADDFEQSGTRNPLDRIELIISTIEKTDPRRAYTPIKWLCARFGFMPPIKMPDIEVSNSELISAILKRNKEFGESCLEISNALKDGKVSRSEYKRCFKEGMEDIAALMALLSRLEELAE